MNVLSCEGVRDTEQSYQINEKLPNNGGELGALKFIIQSWDQSDIGGDAGWNRWGALQLSGNWRENIFLNDPIIGSGMITNISLIVQKLSYEQRYYIN